MLDSLVLNNVYYFLMAWAAAFLAALWLSLVIWAARDIRSRSRDPLLRALAILVVLILFVPGIFVYLILRPSRTLEEEYQQSLEEEALLQTIEDVQQCPGCGRRVKETWQVCPNCYTKLRKPCQECGNLMELPWNLCPYCGTPAPGMRREGLQEDELRSVTEEPSTLEEFSMPEDVHVVEELEDVPAEEAVEKTGDEDLAAT